jgi:5-methylcytosine-specific restriction enzyme A
MVKCIKTGPKVATLKSTTAARVVNRDRGGAYRRNRATVLERDGYLCIECAKHGKVTMAKEVDHVVPLHLGGKDEGDNMQSLCRACHATKTAREAGQRIVER